MTDVDPDRSRPACGPDHRKDCCCRLIDGNHTVSLHDVGLAGYSAGVSVDRDGTVTLWVLNDELVGQAGVDHGNEHPRHELLGRLPVNFRDRLWGGQLRCGRPTTRGRPCGMRVASPGEACGIHAARGGP